jgi:hypothetical protein
MDAAVLSKGFSLGFSLGFSETSIEEKGSATDAAV